MLMRFEEALEQMRKGKETKLGNYIFYIENNIIWKHLTNDVFKLLGHLSYEEIMSENWEVVEDE